MRWKVGLTGPWRAECSRAGLPVGWFAEETGTFTSSPVYVAPVLNIRGEGCALWSVLSGGSWG